MVAYLVTVRSLRDSSAPQQLYLLAGQVSLAGVQLLADALLHDGVVQAAECQPIEALSTAPGTWAEVAYRAGVTDNEAESVRLGAERLGLSGIQVVRTLRRHRLADAGDMRTLANPLIQAVLRYSGEATALRAAWYAELLQTPVEGIAQVAQVALREADDDELMHISRQGILALDLAEMHVIRDYYRAEGRDPTDGELETLAQTWSEHCSHKTFKARVHYAHTSVGQDRSLSAARYPNLYRGYRMLEENCEIDSLIKTFLMSATDQLMKSESGEPFVLSAFIDNAGIVAFDAEYELSIKVETHNHPSALEPFGGANTGVGGVVRDVLGVSALPIANTDVLCFGPLDTPDSELSPGVLPPRHVAAGVVAGVRDYGNKIGIPIVNGAVLYDPGYTANPLVYCGTIGLAPRGRHPRGAKPGDLVVVLGGRTGRDGIHGATFSSEELTHTTAQDVGSAVQIGDPITEKKMIDVVLQARDARLYHAITDCGAGGLSSAVGEMGEETGALVTLETVPLKYAGLQPWEIWLSEAQERMVLAVPPQSWPELHALCESEDVETTVIGHFTGDQRLIVRHQTLNLVNLGMDFVHGGRPQRVLDAIWAGAPKRARAEAQANTPIPSLSLILSKLLAHPNIASKESIVRTYDHEVQGRTVIKPLVGVQSDGPGDAAVLQPVRSSMRGVAVGCGINPRYGLDDPYWMALACIDEALRNVVAVGGDPAQAAILDNFCWGDPRHPDRMAGLVRAAAGCYDAALAYRTPFISGKDSLNNEYRDAQGIRTPIPPTLLISALALLPDVRQAVTMDLKEAGNRIYLIGLTKDELAESHYAMITEQDQRASSIPQVNLATAPQIMAAVHAAVVRGLVRACHDLSEGGLGVTAAEMALAGELGMHLDLRRIVREDAHDNTIILFSESPSRFLIEVPSSKATTFEAVMDGLPHAWIGDTTTETAVVIIGLDGTVVLHAEVSVLKQAWQGKH